MKFFTGCKQIAKNKSQALRLLSKTTALRGLINKKESFNALKAYSQFAANHQQLEDALQLAQQANNALETSIRNDNSVQEKTLQRLCKIVRSRQLKAGLKKWYSTLVRSVKLINISKRVHFRVKTQTWTQMKSIIARLTQEKIIQR